MVNALSNRGYIKHPKKLKKKKGYYVYDDKVEAAFNQFQRDAGLSTTYAADTAALNALQKWESMNTMLQLGDREIKMVNVDFGPDVAELIDILKTLGYEFGQETIIYNQSQPYYTQIVREAVMDFQSKNKLTPDGVVNDKTAKKLKKKAKKK